MAMMFLLVLLGASVWGVSEIIKKRQLLNKADVSLMVVATMLGASVFALPAQFIILGQPELQPGLWLPLIGDILLNVAIQYLGVMALKREDASIVAPLQGLTPLFLILTSWLMLKEFPTTFGLIGILVTVTGTYILALQGKDKRTGFFAPWGRLGRSKGALIAISTAILGSIALNFNKVVVLNSSPILRASMVFFAVSVIVWLVSITSGQWQKIGNKKKLWWPLFGIGLLIGLANVLMDSGFLFGIVPYVGSLKRFQIVVVILLSGPILHEGFRKSRLAAAVTIVAGIALLAF